MRIGTQSYLIPFVCCLTAIASVRAHNATDDQPEVAAALQRIREKVADISRDRTEEQVIKEIDAWKQREPNSAQPYVVLANYYLQKTVQPTQVNLRPTAGKQERKKGGDEIGIVDPKTGKQVGVFEEEPVGPAPDPAKVQTWRLTAADELARALKVAPNRLDIMIGRASILGDAHQWKPLTQQMEMAMQRAATDPQNLRWLEDKPTPRNPPDEVIDSLHGKILGAFRQRDAEGDARAGELAAMGLKYFPNDVKLLADLGSSRSFAGDWKGAIAQYEHAAAIDPTDSIVIGNLARAYLNLGEKEKARVAANKVIALNNDADAVALAHDVLKQTGGGRRRK